MNANEIKNEVQAAEEMLESLELRLGKSTLHAMQGLRMIALLFNAFVEHTQPPEDLVKELGGLFCNDALDSLKNYIRFLHPEMTQEELNGEFEVFQLALARVQNVLEKVNLK